MYKTITSVWPGMWSRLTVVFHQLYCFAEHFVVGFLVAYYHDIASCFAYQCCFEVSFALDTFVAVLVGAT
jgi:hypothetical protein